MTGTAFVAYQISPAFVTLRANDDSKRISSLRVVTKLICTWIGSRFRQKDTNRPMCAGSPPRLWKKMFTVSDSLLFFLLSVPFQSVLGSSWLDGESIEWKLNFCNPQLGQLFQSHKTQLLSLRLRLYWAFVCHFVYKVMIQLTYCWSPSGFKGKLWIILYFSSFTYG